MYYNDYVDKRITSNKDNKDLHQIRRENNEWLEQKNAKVVEAGHRLARKVEI
jgi:hypothetical protein